MKTRNGRAWRLCQSRRGPERGPPRDIEQKGALRVTQYRYAYTLLAARHAHDGRERRHSTIGGPPSAGVELLLDVGQNEADQLRAFIALRLLGLEVQPLGVGRNPLLTRVHHYADYQSARWRGPGRGRGRSLRSELA